MENILAVFISLTAAIAFASRSVKIVTESNQAVVERLGKYHRVLRPGFNLINPFFDVIVIEDTEAERVLDIDPHPTITKDNVSLSVNAVVYWRVMDLALAYYKVDDVEEALKNLVITTMRAEIGQMELQETFSSRKQINQALLKELDDDTVRWGIKVYRVEVQDIKPAASVLEALEMERAAESKKKASILEAEGTVEAMQKLSKALQAQANSRDILQYLVAQRYVDASQRLSESSNAKIVYMSGEAVTKSINELLQNTGPSFQEGNGQNPGSANGSGQNPNSPNGNGQS